MRDQGETLPAPIGRALRTCFRRVRAPWLRRAARPEPDSWFGSGMMAFKHATSWDELDPLETDIAFLPHANDNADTLAFLRKTTTVPREGGCT